MKTPCLEPVPATTRPADAPWRLGVTAACLAARMEDRIEAFACAEAENLGHLEDQPAADGRELLRQAAELGAQKKADATPPRCQRALTHLSAGHDRRFATRFGEVTVRRTRGYCPKCRKWRCRPTRRWGRPAWSWSGSPASKCREPRTTGRRAAKGGGAQALRRELGASPVSPARQTELPLEPYQMILQIDAWNIRERDQWGASQAGRKKGQEPERWHWVYTGTCFRLDHRGQAAGALVIADGAVWIWRLADDRFLEARQRLIFITRCNTSPPSLARSSARIRPG